MDLNIFDQFQPIIIITIIEMQFVPTSASGRLFKSPPESFCLDPSRTWSSPGNPL